MATCMPPEHTLHLTKSYSPRPAWLRSVLERSGLEELKMANLTNKIALVTGGSRGIGAGIAKRLAGDGASVAITYTRGAEAAASVVNEIERDGGKAIAIQADATDAKAVVGAVEKTVATY